MPYILLAERPRFGLGLGSVTDTAKGAAQMATQAIKTSDQVVKDLDIPIMKQALALQDKIFQIADDLGVGDEVRRLVYALRTYEYASVLVSNIVPVAATEAVGQVLAGIGGAAALGAVGIVVGVLAFIFGGSDDDALKQRQVRAQELANQLVKRLDLQGLASEEDGQEATNLIFKQAAAGGIMKGSPADYQAKANLAHRLAQFYRAADNELSGDQKELFVSLSNIGRWDSARIQLLNIKLGDPFMVALVPTILSKIVPQLESERAHFANLSASMSAGQLASATLSATQLANAELAAALAATASVSAQKAMLATIAAPSTKMNPIAAIAIGMGLAAVAAALVLKPPAFLRSGN